MLPKAQMTEMKTTELQSKTTYNERKKMYSNNEEAKMESAKKIYISLTMRLATTTRMCGKPAKYTLPKCFS